MARLWDDVTYDDYRTAALACRTRPAFEASAFFARHGEGLRAFLSTPWIRPCHDPEPADEPSRAPSQLPHPASGSKVEFMRARSPAPSARASRAASLRVVQWNLEKGLQLDRIRRRLLEDPDLAAADVYCLQEVDVGMARSGNNADVGAELASALGCHLVYQPSYLECTKGPGQDALAPSENTHGLHGLAVLSRHPVTQARTALLPECWDYFDYPIEKRYGSRQVLVATLDWRGRPVRIATSHLEVRNVPRCRARQMEAALAALASADGDLPTVFTGDFNTNSFRRGGLVNTVREFLRIVTTPEERLAAELAAPFSREPLFATLDRAGFAYRPFTDGAWTAETLLGSAEDLAVLPRPIADWVARTFGLGSRYIQMRLDWITARGFLPAGPPRTVTAEIAPRTPASDHAIVWADLTPADQA